MRKCYTLFFLSIMLAISCSEHDGVSSLSNLESGDKSSSEVSVAAIKGGDSKSEINIVHSWVNEIGDVTLAFSESGNYSYIYDDGDSQYKEYGTYSISDNYLKAVDPDGYSYTETIEFDGSILTLRDEYGYSQSYSKI